MSIYEKPAKALMQDFVRDEIKEGQTFAKVDATRWFDRNYPKIKSNTVRIHVDVMAVNSLSRKHHQNIKPGSGHDLFFKLGKNSYRLWDPSNDPVPIYKGDLEAEGRVRDAEGFEDDHDEASVADGDTPSVEFAYERDLKNYLAKNLGTIEPGLRVFEDEGLSGIEYPAGGRYIDILASDASDNFVVIELKVSKGYDRVVGQILRYMGWVERNLADGKEVRGMIVAADISEDLKLATSRVSGISLLEYEISFAVKTVDMTE